MRLWKSKDVAACPQNDDVATVRHKLAEVDQQIKAAEVDLRRVSLVAALSDNPDAGADTIARLSALRS